jgi:starch synthase
MGGQVVLMGVLTQDNRAFQILEELKERQKNEELFADNLKIYTDLKKDQLDFISDTFIPKGKLIRFASDLICIPSKAEACGLVAMESICFGTPIFTSWVQGLKDSCFPYGVFHPLLGKVIDHTNFNAFSFQYFPEDFRRTVKDMNKNLRRTYNIISGKEMAEEIRLIAQKRMIDMAGSFDWDAPKGSLEQYLELYASLIGDAYQKPRVHGLNKELKSKENNLVYKLFQKFDGYPSEKIVFKYEKFYPFVMTTLKQGKREYETKDNKPNLKDLTRVTIKNGHLYFNNGLELFNTDTLRSKDFYCTWVLNKKGNLFSGAFCHAYFLKSKPGRPYYGYGKPIACAGDIIVKEGKIVYIDNRSGHYEPNKDQFLLVLHYLNSLNIFDNNCVIKEEKMRETISLEDVRKVNILDVISKYPSLEGLIN